MSGFLKISEAASCGMHALVFLAAHPEKLVRARELAGFCQSSEAHMAKILQRLAKVRLVRAERGPTGGYRLHRPANEINLLQVVSALDGDPETDSCLMNRRACADNGQLCVFSELTHSVNRQVLDYLTTTRLDQLAVRCRLILTRD
ncbi:MAG: Rrf2 family transcriptional regulator [Myxococcales bacterium]|nr:MAG: Rrf2 family transcriptional regulator [Myxococcales bacterium]